MKLIKIEKFPIMALALASGVLAILTPDWRTELQASAYISTGYSADTVVPDFVVPTLLPSCSLNAQPSSVSAGDSVTLTPSCTGTEGYASYSWTGGTCEGATSFSCTVTPSVTTSYSVTATNAIGKGNTASATVIVVSKIRASFTYYTKSASTPLEIDFTASGSSSNSADNLIFSWNFGDGKTGEGTNVQHSYQNAGNYTVNLTVDNGNGQSTTVSSTVIATAATKITQPSTLIAANSFALNNSADKAIPILINDQPLFQILSGLNSENWFEFYAKAGQSYTIDIPGASVGKSINPSLSLYDSAGKLLVNQTNTKGNGQSIQIIWTAPKSDFYRIKVTNSVSNTLKSSTVEQKGEATDYAYQIRVFLTDAPQRGIIKGTILSSCDHRGISGADVSIVGVLNSSTLTDKFGAFSIPVTPGNYYVKAVAAGFREASKSAVLGQDGLTITSIDLLTASTCANVLKPIDPLIQAQQAPVVYDDQQSILFIKDIVVNGQVYYVELTNIGDYRFQISGILPIPGVIHTNYAEYFPLTSIANLPEVFANNSTWKIKLKSDNNSVMSIDSVAPF
ncbi:PKD domain-containing protein [Candidatus Methylobacter oryzae]|nr:PKD domain-containing protein [Candidatus Methylobacter oryzae]